MPRRAPYDWAAAVHAEMVPQMTTATQMSLASQRTGSQPGKCPVVKQPRVMARRGECIPLTESRAAEAGDDVVRGNLEREVTNCEEAVSANVTTGWKETRSQPQPSSPYRIDMAVANCCVFMFRSVRIPLSLAAARFCLSISAKARQRVFTADWGRVYSQLRM